MNNGPPPKKQRLDMKSIINFIKNSDLKTKNDKINYLKKYKYIHTDYTFLYNIIINNDLNNNTLKEVNILNQMLAKIGDINDNKLSKKKGEEQIGQVLVDNYVMPMLQKNKKNNEK